MERIRSFCAFDLRRQMVKRSRKPNAKAWQWRESRTARRRDELIFGDQVFATLRWEGPFSKLAYARSPEGQWTFDRPRLLSRDVEVRQPDETLIAIYLEKWTGDGTLEFVDGRTCDWAPTNFWQTRWSFFDADNKPLVTFDDTSGLFEHTAQITFWPSDLSAADSGLLATLGRYLTALKQQDIAVIAATTTTIAAT
jgi:hypothetical protein